MGAFAVFGNPIKHSKSAEIYAFFAKKIGISEKYDLKLVLETENFDDMLYDFFKSEGLGANVTVPFKERAFFLCNKFTKRAKLACAVNTIKKEYDGSLLGDNTDGIGFISDLKRLNWIDKNFFISENKDRKKEKILAVANVLLIGAGGAAKGIIPELLNISNCNLKLVNRTYSKAQVLVQFYSNMGYKNISCMPLKLLLSKSKEKYNLIINATSSSMYNVIPEISSSIITPVTKCYDLFYQRENTVFLMWCQRHGSKYCADGLGMLVEQAAHSFYLWHNLFPESTVFFLSYLRSIL